MKIVAVRVGKPGVVEEIDNTLEAMQAFVGGYIDVVHLFWRDEVVLVCNEEGYINGSSINRKAAGDRFTDWISGDFFLVGVDGENFCSLTDAQADEMVRLYKEVYD